MLCKIPFFRAFLIGEIQLDQTQPQRPHEALKVFLQRHLREVMSLRTFSTCLHKLPIHNLNNQVPLTSSAIILNSIS